MRKMKPIQLRGRATAYCGLRSYQILLNEVGKIPVLTKEEERALFQKYKATGCQKSLDKIVKHNVRFAMTVAKKFHDKFLDTQDLIQICTEYLIEAAKRFDVDNYDNKFISYAVFWMRAGIGRKLGRFQNPLSVPKGHDRRVRAIAKAVDALVKEGNEHPSIEEVYNKIHEREGKVNGCSMDIVRAFYNCHHSKLEDFAGDAAKEWKLLDVVPVDNHDAIKENQEKREQIDAMVEALSPREKFILFSYYGIGDEHTTAKTLDEIAAEMGLTRERIRQINHRAIRKIRKRFNKGRFDSLF